MWYKKAGEHNKRLIVVRGISGSGKSTLAKSLAGDTGVVFSTDDYFLDDEEYKFDVEKLGEAHGWNQSRAIAAMESGISPIVIDNTNTQAWEPQAYVKAALSNGYEVEIREPETDWKFNAEELAKRNKHGLPVERIQQMIDQWQPDITVDDILQAVPPEQIDEN
jgi:NEDD4-binding protein 2